MPLPALRLNGSRDSSSGRRAPRYAGSLTEVTPDDLVRTSEPGQEVATYRHDAGHVGIGTSNTHELGGRITFHSIDRFEWSLRGTLGRFLDALSISSVVERLVFKQGQ